MTEVDEEDLPIYELCSTSHPTYSHCIVRVCVDEIIAYKNEETGVWNTTEALLESDPESMDMGFMMHWPTSAISQKELCNLISPDELFFELL